MPRPHQIQVLVFFVASFGEVGSSRSLINFHNLFIDTPVLRHKRVAALQENRPNSAEKRSPDELIDKPWPPLAEMAETLNWDTPTREHYQKIVSEDNEMMQNETPNTKRRRLEEFSKIGTPELREYVSTPYQEKLRQAERDEGRRLAEERRALLMQESTKKSMVYTNYAVVNSNS